MTDGNSKKSKVFHFIFLYIIDKYFCFFPYLLLSNYDVFWISLVNWFFVLLGKALLVQENGQKVVQHQEQK